MKTTKAQLGYRAKFLGVTKQVEQHGAELSEQIEKAKASVKHLRAEADELREGGEDLEDEQMLSAARRLEARARETEKSIALGERTLKMIAERKAGVRR